MLTDDFNDGNFAGWTVVDEGTVKAPSNWNAATGELVQASNIHDGDTDPATLPKLGTLAWYDNGLAWSNYQVGLTLRSQDQDALGVIFRYQDPNNYYRFSWDRWRAYRRLVKVENGVFTLLAEDSVLYTVGQTYAVDIQANGDTIDVSIDGVQVFAVTDSGTTLTTGSIGLYSWGNNGGFYDNIQVDSVSPPPPPQTLTVSLTGNGTVTSSPGGIACPGDCTEDFPGGQSVTLTATPAAGSIFLGWSGDCPGTGNCVVSMTQARAVTATFDIASSTTLPFSDSFDDGNFTGWTVVDEGTNADPSAWSATTGALVQSSNIYGGSTDGSLLPKPGTFLFYSGGSTWTDYQVGLTLRSQDQDALGVIFRYQDPNNYYRFSWDRWRAYRRLVKVENGVFTLLAEDSVLYTVGQTYAVDIQANGDTIDVSIDGVQVFAVTDSGTTLTTGSIGLYSWGNNGSYFDNLVVDDSVGPPPPPQTLTVSLTGNGTVTSSPGGIACPGDCTEDFPGGQSVTLTATPAAGSIFLGWSGDCPGTGNCVVSMTQARAVTATFDIASSTTLPFSDSFDDGNFTGWTVVDEGTNADPSAWSATTGALVQSSNIYGGSTDGSLLPKPGTFLFYSGGSTWTDYQATFTMSSTDNDALGVMVRYQDPDNYYRFSWDSQRQYRRLVKVENGVFTLLAEDSVAYTVGQTYAVDILANGDSVQVWIDGVQVFAVTDSGTTLTTGSIGLYSWGNNGSYFDNLVVDDSVSPPPPLQTLTVSLTGDGTVTSSPTGITCPGNCTENYPSGQSVTLTATPASGSVFLGWSGDCPGTGSCIVSMTQARAVTASFDTSTTTLLSDNFDDGNFTSWTVVDEGTVKAPSNWGAATGELVQASNIHDGDTNPATLPKRGTFAWYDNGLAWSNYQVELTLRSQDQDALGVIFRYQDPNNYYRFSWDRWRAYRRLVKVENGVFSLLAEDSVVYTVGHTYAVDIQANGDTIEVSIDGVQVFAVTDSGTTLTTGSIGLYSWGNNGSYFDDIQVSEKILHILSPQELDVITTTIAPIPPTIEVTVQTAAIGIPSNWGVEFVVDGDDLNAVQDYTSPFELVTNLVPAEHTVTSYLIDEVGVRQTNSFDEVNFGVGDSYVAFGDSITFGANHDNVTQDDVSADGRNSGGGYEPILNDLLTDAKNYPHSVENEGISGDETIDGVMRITDVLAARPNSNYYLIMFGTNDSFLPVPSGMGLTSNDPGYPGTYKDNMQQIITAILQEGKTPLLAKVPIRYGDCGSGCNPFPNPSAAPGNLLIQEYNIVVDELVISNGVEDPSGNSLTPPDLYTYFEGTQVVNGKSVEFDDFLHPNGVGLQSMANLWLQSLAP